MRKLIALSIIAMFAFSQVAFAAVGVNVVTAGTSTPAGTAGNININCPFGETPTTDGFNYNPTCTNLLSAGTANGNATSMTTADLTISVAYSYVKKAIAASANPGFSAGILPAGNGGQILTLQITSVGASGTYVLTPALATGFTSITYSIMGQRTSFLYVNDTVGWIILSNDAYTGVAAPVINGFN